MNDKHAKLNFLVTAYLAVVTCLAGCDPAGDPYEEYLESPPSLGLVWAADGESFVVASGNALVRWEAGEPSEVFLKGPRARGLWGHQDELRWVSTNEGLYERAANGWRLVTDVTGDVRSMVAAGGERFVAEGFPTGFEGKSETRILRASDTGWVEEASFMGPYLSVQLHALPWGAVWATRQISEDATDFDGDVMTTVLLRRDDGVWTEVPCPYLVPAWTNDATSNQPDFEQGVWLVGHIWGDSAGRVHVVDGWGQGELIFDGQTWEKQSFDESMGHSIVGVRRAPDGVYYGFTPRDWWSQDHRYLAIDRGDGWEMHHLGFNYDIRGFAPYAGGVIITACTPAFSFFSDCITGLVMRATPAGEITILRQFRLTDP